MIQAMLIDLDGVVYQGERIVPGAIQTLRWLKEEAIPHLFVTNTSSRPRSSIVYRLAVMGINVIAEELLTPPVAACDWLASKGKRRLALFVKQSTQAEFADFQLLDKKKEMDADAVVIGDMGDEWDFATLNRAFRLLMTQPSPALIALGMTRYWRAADGLRLDTAPFVVALEHASGVKPIVLGKPARPFYEAALEILGEPVEQVAMLGDDIRGDVEGAQNAGLKGLLVKTGKYQTSDLGGDIHPDAVLDSIADLPIWWRRQSA